MHDFIKGFYEFIYSYVILYSTAYSLLWMTDNSKIN